MSTVELIQLINSNVSNVTLLDLLRLKWNAINNANLAFGTSKSTGLVKAFVTKSEMISEEVTICSNLIEFDFDQFLEELKKYNKELGIEDIIQSLVLSEHIAKNSNSDFIIVIDPLGILD